MPTIPASNVANVRTRNSQDNIAKVRMVNEQVRGEGAGERTLFDTDATQLSTEMAAQKAIANYARINQQISKAATAPCIPANAIENVRTSVAQRNLADVRIVNEQIRGDNMHNQFGQGGIALSIPSTFRLFQAVHIISRFIRIGHQMCLYTYTSDITVHTTAT